MHLCGTELVMTSDLDIQRQEDEYKDSVRKSILLEASHHIVMNCEERNSAIARAEQRHQDELDAMKNGEVVEDEHTIEFPTLPDNGLGNPSEKQVRKIKAIYHDLCKIEGL